jgi:hypothetical protein
MMGNTKEMHCGLPCKMCRGGGEQYITACFRSMQANDLHLHQHSWCSAL